MKAPHFFINKPSEIKNPIVINNFINRGEDRFWNTNYQGTLNTYQKKLKNLSQKILSFGGNQVVLPSIEEDLEYIQMRGVFCIGEHSILKRGLPSQCHRNSCDLYMMEEREDFFIMTGYALSKDGFWRQHSWCVDYKNEKIIETTEPRIAYFGFVMTHSECDDFCFDNY
tara:strand:- start:1790 stop:2296 length:507 start_codon:yes stop_codon:yes gene_type:complete